MRKAWLVMVSALALAGCHRSVQGTYNMVNGPAQGVVATFGEKTFSLSTGASGNYEVSNGNVILSGSSLSGTFKIEGEKLVGDRFSFVPRAPGDKTPIDKGPREGGFSKAKAGSFSY
ncbi:hypothetical protein [Novosphingobium terrae]|uniref:hypothetical protein n=1 Tax=Novosphingobium terrae TaxID=2726189 RepID=UPI00197FAE34|nr:hypothetical protein [Novosphingobium terrae]